jgi:lipopolysaccharide/colanic/teichoic acid biosynthesis glycosyltransferase
VSYPVAKRALDLSIALPLVLLLSPVFAFLFVAIAADMVLCREDRGSWLYRERRISRGREFDLLKFRTLRRDALAAMSGESHARLLEADQSNLTWSGRQILKPWYLDELPQLWNVIRGEMSLVGPRPWPPSMVAMQVGQGLTYRNEFVAGWTGPAQIRKGITQTSGYAELDLAYVEAVGTGGALKLLRVDLAILSRTLLVLARGEGLEY